MLKARSTPGASVTPGDGGWRLEIPAGPGGVYRLAQLDDYATLPRGRFPWGTRADLRLRCRVSDSLLPGTWGFGLWNDPFAFSLGLGGAGRRMPALPNAAWCFHASAENHLSLRDLPGSGFLAQSFSAPKVPALLLAPGVILLPLLFSRVFARWIRAAGARLVSENGTRLQVDPTAWHTYQLRWQPGGVCFSVDETAVFETDISPRGPLGLVIWIDNQFAAFTPEGRVGAGTLENRAPAWMEIADLQIKE